MAPLLNTPTQIGKMLPFLEVLELLELDVVCKRNMQVSFSSARIHSSKCSLFFSPSFISFLFFRCLDVNVNVMQEREKPKY
jgi:hypothetical protein